MATPFGIGDIGNTAGRRAVARRVSEQHRGFIAWDQTLVAVDRGRADRRQRRGVGEDAGEELVGQLGEAQPALVVLVGKQVGLAVAQRHVDVHAVARLEQEGLGHERDVETVPLGAEPHDVLEQHGVVGHLHHHRARQRYVELPLELTDRSQGSDTACLLKNQ